MIRSKNKQRVALLLMSTFLLGTGTLPATVLAATEPPGEPPAGGNGPNGEGGPGGGAHTMTYDYTGELKGNLVADGKESTVKAKNYQASAADENTALVKNGGKLTLTDAVLEKTGESGNDDNSNFYGLNSVLLAVNEKSFAYLTNSQIKATDKGSNGLFATDKGTIYANDNTIDTKADSSRGMDATYGGTIIANKATIDTKGDHSAALATDRGGGNVSVTDSQFKTHGSGSPLLYSTGDIEVNNVSGTSTGSQIAGMEGYNSIQIYHSDLTSKLTGTTGSDPVANGVIIYQSTSGDAEASTGEKATFEAVDSTLKSATEGTMFYVTNTDANIVLNDSKLDFDSEKAALLTIQGNDSNGWGTAGSNGGTVTATGIDQELKGKITVDSISSLNLALTKKTTYSGSTEITKNETETKANETPITVSVDNSSKWIVTGDSQVTNLNVASGGKVVDQDGKTASIVVAGKKVVEGTGSKTVTVTGNYSEEVKTDDNNKLSDPSIDRSNFDQHYQVKTAFTKESSKTTTAAKNSSQTAVSSTSKTAKSTDSSMAANSVKSSSSTKDRTLWYGVGAVVVAAIVGRFIFKRIKNN